jgi:hypothetical protein
VSRTSNIGRAAKAVMHGAMILLFASAAGAQTGSSMVHIQKARDVATNSTGATWIISADGSPNGTIQRSVGLALVTVPGAAVRIAVDPLGNAWVVNSAGDLYRWEKPATAPATWVLSNLKAMDVGVGANGAVWPSAPIIESWDSTMAHGPQFRVRATESQSTQTAIHGLRTAIMTSGIGPAPDGSW